MNDTTDTPLSEEQEIDLMFEQPDQPDSEDDTAEAPQDGTEAAEAELDDDASEAEDDEIGEAEAEDEDDDQDPEDDQEPAERYTVKVDGEDVQVTLDELQRGYSGQAYIQKGMAEVAESRKALTEAMQGVNNERQAIMQMYQQAQATGFMPEPTPPDMSLLEADPIGYMQAEAQYKQQLGQYQAEQQNIQFLRQQEQQQQQYLEQQHKEQQKARLLEAMPELSDPGKARKFYERMVQSGAEYYQFAPEEIGGVMDARAVQVLADAVAYRELKAGKNAAKQPREDARAVTKQRGKPRSAGKITSQKALERARKTQSDEAWVDVLLS